MDEQHAIEMIKLGNPSGLEALVDQYYFQAVRVSYLIVQDRFQAEDIVQSAFIKAYEKIHQLMSDRFGPWFFRIIVNASIKASKQQQRKISLDDVDDDDIQSYKEWLVDRKPLPEELLETKEIRRGVWYALMQLTADQRAVIVLKYYLNLSELEITQELNTPRTTVKWRLFTARERLRSLLHPQRPKLPESGSKLPQQCSEQKE